MLIRSLLLVLLTTSTSLYGAVVSNYSDAYSINGTYGTPGSSGNNYGNQTSSGTTSEEEDFFGTELGPGPDGYGLTVSGRSRSVTLMTGDEQEFQRLELGGGYNWSGVSGIQTGFTIHHTATFATEFASTLTFSFDSFSLENGFSGSVYLKLNSVTVSEPGAFELAAGTHTIEFYANGLNLSPQESDGSQNFQVTADIMPVPEPSSWVLIAGGMAAAIGVARRRKSQLR